MSRTWAIMGTGSVASALAEAIQAEGGTVAAVGSGSAERARAFADRFDIEHAHDNHYEVLAHDDVEVVYIATTNERHHLDVQACVAAGVAVLSEKTFALQRDQAASVLDVARQRGVFVAEAMWMRVQPGFLALHEQLAAGAIGTPRMVQADFGIVAEPDPTRRWFSREQGGGALLDVGIYPLTFAVSVLGAPTRIRALAELASTGVDAQLVVAMTHERGLSSWSCSFVADSGVEATVAGETGSLRLGGPFHHGSDLTRRERDQVVETIEVKDADLGYRHEVREVHRCLDAGLTESPALAHADTLTVLDAMDRIRDQIGVSYG